MEIGLKIKSLRLKQGITQEMLAEKLNVTPQAISKWENSNNTPDISLLPKLSIIFGTTIDDLFSLTDENHMDRIEQAIDNEYMLSRKEFNKYNEFLTSKLSSNQLKNRAMYLLGSLYIKQSESYKALAHDFAVQLLEVEPDVKDNHNLLCDSSNGIICDWNISNHHKIIDYYMNFIKKNPTYSRGYLWLLDLLIADGRCEEAKIVLEQMHNHDKSFRYLLYKALIAKADCDIEAAEKFIDEMVKKFPDDWMSWASKADFMAKCCDYDKAIVNYEKACAMQPSPKYTDSYEAIAHIYEINKDYSKAIDYYLKVIELLKNEWNITEGEIVNNYKREIERLKKMTA